MDKFSRHGGLIVDEMKPSEHISGSSAGQGDGFIDLGSFTSAEDKHAVGDHDMVIMFMPFVGSERKVLEAFATR